MNHAYYLSRKYKYENKYNLWMNWNGSMLSLHIQLLREVRWWNPEYNSEWRHNSVSTQKDNPHNLEIWNLESRMRIERNLEPWKQILESCHQTAEEALKIEIIAASWGELALTETTWSSSTVSEKANGRHQALCPTPVFWPLEVLSNTVQTLSASKRGSAH